MTEIKSLSIDELKSALKEMGEKPFRAGQIFKWLHEGVESVLMHYEHGVSVCVSTQVGCRMGCKFCASGLNGRTRSLSAGEILDEILFMQKDSGEKVSNIVLMGTGEPLDNYDNVLKFLHLVSCPEGINIGQSDLPLFPC